MIHPQSSDLALGPESLSCFDRIQAIVSKIQACDGVLKTRQLAPSLVSLAHKLVAEIERNLEHLGRSTAEHAFRGPQERVARISQISKQLSSLDTLCDELAAIVSRPAQGAIPTVEV